MKDPTLLVRGMGYVPGIARGILQRGVAVSGMGIALITQEQVGKLAPPLAGIVLVDGAPFSHETIALPGLGVPTVIIRGADAAGLQEGLDVVIDGGAGTVSAVTGPVPAWQPPAPPHAGTAIRTRDGIEVELRASVRSVAAARKARAMGAASIGLVRTEFFAPANGQCPDAGYYTREFDALCTAASPLPVTFRLLDIADDKLPAWLPLYSAMTGSLGMQGVRLFGDPVVANVVRAQLAVISQLSHRYPVRVLLPYLVRREELRHWIALARAHLPEDVPVGAMVETPAGALDLEHWFDLADFIAVGCNDLMQCLFAADRNRSELRAYLDPYAPLLYRFLRSMARRAGEHLGKTQLCGVLPQLEGVLPILLGLGYRVFSVDPARIPHLAQVAGCASCEDAEILAQSACAALESTDVLELLHIPAAGNRPYLWADSPWA